MKAWSQTSTRCSLASALMSEKSMIMPLSELPSRFDDRAHERDFERVAVPVQVAALAFVVGDAVTCIEFKLAGNG